MSKLNYEGDTAFRPISAWGYVGYSILFAIPIIGWICLIVFTFSDKNINRRSFARSYWIKGLLSIVVMCLLIFGVMNPLIKYFYGANGTYRDLTNEIATELLRSNPHETNEEPRKATGTKTEIAEDDAGDMGVTESAKYAPTDFYEAMDSFEAFFDEYVAFMNNYDENDSSALAAYTSMMARYAETMEKLDEIDEDELTDDELAYYIDVMARIEKKLLELT